MKPMTNLDAPFLKLFEQCFTLPTGQFFHYGVRLDVNAALLHLPGRPSVPVEKQDLWKFMEQSFHSESQCWTSSYPSSQGAGIVAGSYKDYIVDGLLAVGQ